MQKEDGTYIKSRDIVWHPDIEYSDCLRVFVDKSTGWAYEVDAKDETKAHVSHYLMSYNMYEKTCWLCKKEKCENDGQDKRQDKRQDKPKPPHNGRCFFCANCCTLKEHPNPHL
jgi:hypothetical protein